MPTNTVSQTAITTLVFKQKTEGANRPVEYMHVQPYCASGNAGFRVGGKEIATSFDATFVYAEVFEAALYTKFGEKPNPQKWAALVFINNINGMVFTTLLKTRSIKELWNWIKAKNAKKKNLNDISPAIGASVRISFDKSTTNPRLVEGSLKTFTYQYVVFESIDNESHYRNMAINLHEMIKRGENLPDFDYSNFEANNET